MQLVARDPHDVAGTNGVLAGIDVTRSADLAWSGHGRVDKSTVHGRLGRSMTHEIDLVDVFVRLIGTDRAVVDDHGHVRASRESKLGRLWLVSERLVDLRLAREVGRRLGEWRAAGPSSAAAACWARGKHPQ